MGYLHPGRRRDALCHTGLTCSVPCIASEWTLWPLVSLVLSVTGFPVPKRSGSTALAQVWDSNAFEEQSHRSNEN